MTGDDYFKTIKYTTRLHAAAPLLKVARRSCYLTYMKVTDCKQTPEENVSCDSHVYFVVSITCTGLLPPIRQNKSRIVLA